MNKGTLLAMGALLGAAGTAVAQDQTPVITPKNYQTFKVEPIKVAKTTRRWRNGKFRHTRWQNYEPGGVIASGDPQQRIFDAFEGAIDVCQTMGDLFMANGPLSGGVEPACDFDAGLTGDCGNGDTSRWFFGAEAFFGGYIQQMDGLGAGGNTANFLATAWNVATGTGFTDPCGNLQDDHVIAISIYDSTVGDAIASGAGLTNQQLIDGFKSGVLLNFGPLDAGAGYYWTNVDLGGGLELDIQPGDAYEVLFFNGDSNTGKLLNLAASSQSMLWYPKDEALQGAGDSGNFYMDGASGACETFGNGGDTDPNALFYDPGEFSNFTGGLPGGCPDSIYAMVGFYGVGSVGGTPGFIIDCEITQGSTDNPPCSGNNLDTDDDVNQILRSQFGFTAFERNLVTMVLDGVVGDGANTSLAAIRMRDDLVGGTVDAIGKISARNFTNNVMEELGTYAMSLADPEAESTIGVGSSDYIQNELWEVQVKYVAAATFVATGFVVNTDLVEVLGN